MTAIALVKQSVAVCKRLPLSPTLRYALAALFSLCVNLAVIFLILNAQAYHAIPLPEDEAIALNVIEMELEQPTEEPEPVTRQTNISQEEEITSPKLQMPALELAPEKSSANALVLPDIPGVQSLELLCTVPAVEAPPSPAPTVTVPTVKPKKGGQSRGPMLIEPPDLSAYYPYSARRHRTEGVTRIRLSIDQYGTVGRVEVLDSSPSGTFDMAARRVATSLRFRPALRNGKPAASRISINLHWKLD